MEGLVGMEYSQKKEKQEEKNKLLSIKNIINEWNNLSIPKKIGGIVLLIVGWLIIIDNWLRVDDIIDALG